MYFGICLYDKKNLHLLIKGEAAEIRSSQSQQCPQPNRSQEEDDCCRGDVRQKKSIYQMREMRTLHKNFKFKFNKYVKERDTCLHPHLGRVGYTALLPHYLKIDG